MSEPTYEHFPVKDGLLRILLRVTFYYLIVAGLLWALNASMPAAFERLPFGGIQTIIDDDQAIVAIEDAMLRGDNEVASQYVNKSQVDGRFSDALTLLLAMTGTIVVMLPVAWIYKAIHIKGVYDHSLDETALILPAVVAGIVLIVQHSLALAFSLAGIVAGVRFRRALSDTFDTLFIFVAIGVGIAAGVEALEIAAVMTVFFTYATLGVCLFGDGLESHFAANQKVQKSLRKEKLRQAAAASDTGKTHAPD